MVAPARWLEPLLWLSLVSLFTSALMASSVQAYTGCVDEKGKPVDWYIAYKFPKVVGPAPFNTGFAYAYMTSKSVQQANIEDESDETDGPVSASDLISIESLSRFRKQQLASLGNPILVPEGGRKRKRSNTGERAGNNPYWTFSKKLFHDPKSIIFRTLAPAYSVKGLDTIFYNDQPPKEQDAEKHVTSSGSRAHAKGAVVMDRGQGTGFWLTHSLPLFPPPIDMALGVEGNANQNGQTFMCLSFNLKKTGDQIIHHLVNIYPYVYESHISEELFGILPRLRDLTLEGEKGKKVKHNKNEPNLLMRVTTKGGQDLQLFSKSPYFRQDIYSDWIDQELDTSLYASTWRLGLGGKMGSDCPDTHHVNNVNEFKFETDGKKLTWSYGNDHSKWAISKSDEQGFVCIADINRVKSQFKRGGGAVCIKCPTCWKAFSGLILDVEPCPVKL